SIRCFHQSFGKKEEVRYLLWIRLYRVRRVIQFFQHMEKDIRINYLFTRIVKLLAVELYCTHTAACIFYYLATTLPAEKEGYTWIGSLKLGDYSYSNFREIDLGKRYIVSLYFAIVTMATVGYGDIHAVNVREMIFVMIYVSFDMILGAYLIGNMTALIVKGSKTERFRDKMADIMKYMNRNELGKEICDQIKGHLRLQYESSYTEAVVLQDIPVSIRAKISQTLYRDFIENVPLFKGCSQELKNQIVIGLHEEFFLPGEVIMEQGNIVDQIYFVCHGVLHIAASEGFEHITSFLIQEGVSVNIAAVKRGNDRVASLLVKEGALLNIVDGGSCLCQAVARGDSDFIKRWGNTPVNEGCTSGNQKLVKLLEEAELAELSKASASDSTSEIEVANKVKPRKCTVFPFHPWDPKEKRKEGVVLWIPTSVDELIRMAPSVL
ncbi:hypothetical protein C5167_021708, partial [Papaver somniferum]